MNPLEYDIPNGACGFLRTVDRGKIFICIGPEHRERSDRHFFVPLEKLRKPGSPRDTETAAPFSGPLQEMTRERDVEAFFIQQVRLIGGHTFKMFPSEAGVPDRLVMFPGGRMYLVELKRAREFPSPVQKAWHERAQKRWGVHVSVVTGAEGVTEFIRKMLTIIGPDGKKKPGPKPKTDD